MTKIIFATFYVFEHAMLGFCFVFCFTFSRYAWFLSLCWQIWGNELLRLLIISEFKMIIRNVLLDFKYERSKQPYDIRLAFEICLKLEIFQTFLF